MDAAGAAYDATLTMRTNKDEMVEFVKDTLSKNPNLSKQYPDMMESLDFSYEFSIYGSENNFQEQLVGYYYGTDQRRTKRFYERQN